MSAPATFEVVPEAGALQISSPATALNTERLAARVGLAGALAAGTLLAASAAHTNALVPQSVRPMPAWLAGVFAHSGLRLGHPALVGVVTLMFLSYVLVVRGAGELSARALLTCIAALATIFLLAPVLFSTDVFSYQAYGRMGAIYGTNPYLHGPSTIQLDPLYSFIGEKWVRTPSAYGPLFTALSYPIAHLSIAASVTAYKSIAVLAFLATVALVWNGARLRGLDPMRAAAIVGLNPLTLAWGVGGAHNDLLMLAMMTAGIYFLLGQRTARGGAIAVAATAVKLTAGVVLPFALVAPESNRRRVLAGAGMATVVTAMLALALFGFGTINLLATLQHNQSMGDWQSIPGFISDELGLGGVGHFVSILLGVVFASVTAWLLLRVRRGELDWVTGAGWATLAMLVTASSLLPWYIAWLTPLAALSSDERLRRWTVITTGVMIFISALSFVPHGASLLGL